VIIFLDFGLFLRIIDDSARLLRTVKNMRLDAPADKTADKKALAGAASITFPTR
jgi:hypothetical protein